MNRVIERSKPKEVIFKTLVQDYFLTNPKVNKAIIEIKEDKLTRSGAQNKLYFMWIDDYIKLELGYSKKETHKALVYELLGYDVTIGFNDKEITSLKETKDMKVAEFSRYLEEVDRFSAGLGIILPRPDDYYWLAMGVKAP